MAAELFGSLESARAHITGDAQIWLHGDADANFARIDREIDGLSGADLPASERPALTIEDRALYIYTSGTTGLPKAANINHYRVMLASNAFAGVMDTRASDRMYDCLPMYHTAGGVVATGALLVSGGSVVIREKFSAQRVLGRRRALGVHAVSVYRRALPLPRQLAAAARTSARTSCGSPAATACGPTSGRSSSGGSASRSILEFYAATEGNVSLFNFDGKEGAVGRVPWFVAGRFPTKIVRFDVERQQPVRNAEGFCIECDADEPGEVIGKILKDPSKPGQRFEGYAEQSRERQARSCATCSRRATPGSAPAT